jgi:hypothetical protein
MEESDKAVRVARLTSLADEVFGDGRILEAYCQLGKLLAMGEEGRFGRAFL